MAHFVIRTAWQCSVSVSAGIGASVRFCRWRSLGGGAFCGLSYLFVFTVPGLKTLKFESVMFPTFRMRFMGIWDGENNIFCFKKRDFIGIFVKNAKNDGLLFSSQKHGIAALFSESVFR